MKKILTLLAATLSVAACIYPYDPELDEAPEGVLSVDGNICIGGTSTVRLGTLASLWVNGSASRANLSGAQVWVEDDAGNRYEGKGSLPSGWEYFGNSMNLINPFFTIDTREAPQDRRYRLRIEALGESYASEWNEAPAPPDIREISFTADEDNVFVGVSLDGGENGTGYALLSYEETWTFHADYYPSYEVTYNEELGEWEIAGGTPDMSRYWCWQTRTNNRPLPMDYTGRTESGLSGFPLLSFPRTNNRNHRRYCVSVTASTISKETYRFLHNLDVNTDGGDNLFTPNPGEIAGNLRCESDPEKTVLGYAILSQAVTKRSYLDSRYYITSPPYSLLYLLPDQYETYLSMGYLPLAENLNLGLGATMPGVSENPEGPYGWGRPFCYDCTAAGGTLDKPDFWSETD